MLRVLSPVPALYRGVQRCTPMTRGIRTCSGSTSCGSGCRRPGSCSAARLEWALWCFIRTSDCCRSTSNGTCGGAIPGGHEDDEHLDRQAARGRPDHAVGGRALATGDRRAGDSRWRQPARPGRSVPDRGGEGREFVKMHHVIADAIAGVATLGTFLDPAPEAIVAGGRPGCRPIPRRHRGRQPGPLSTELGRCSKGCMAAATLQNMQAGWPAIRELLAEQPGPGQTSLDRLVGPDRNLALIRKQPHHGQGDRPCPRRDANDLLLAIDGRRAARTAAQPRRTCRRHISVPIYVPVSLRRRLRGPQHGNLDRPDGRPTSSRNVRSGPRLQQIAVETARRKARTRTSLGTLFRGRISRGRSCR